MKSLFVSAPSPSPFQLEWNLYAFRIQEFIEKISSIQMNGILNLDMTHSEQAFADETTWKKVIVTARGKRWIYLD